MLKSNRAHGQIKGTGRGIFDDKTQNFRLFKDPELPAVFFWTDYLSGGNLDADDCRRMARSPINRLRDPIRKHHLNDVSTHTYFRSVGRSNCG